MPRYHFHLHAENSHLCDGEGMVLLDQHHAVVRATQIVREMVANDLREDGEICLAQSIEIADADGRPLTSIAFRDVVRIVGG